MRIQGIHLLILATLLSCGGQEKTPTSRSLLRSQTIAETILISPLVHYFAFDKDPEDDDRVMGVSRKLPSSHYEALEEYKMSNSGIVESVITGVEIAIENANGKPLEVDLALLGRKYNADDLSLSSTPKLFESKRGLDYSRGQFFKLSSKVADLNRMVAGLGLSIFRGKVTTLKVTKKTLDDLKNTKVEIKSPFLPESSSQGVLVDPGYVIVGLWIRIHKDEEDTRFPFVSDIRLDSATIGEVN